MTTFLTRLSLILLFWSCVFQKDCFCQNSSLAIDDCDTSIFCIYNNDNIIFQPFKEFTFLLRTNVEPKDFREYEKSYPPDLFQEPIVLKLKILPECFYDQTMVRYEYLINDSLFNFESTGLIENKKSAWIHPPRSLINEIEYSPYFEYRYEKSKWRNGLLMVNANPKISNKKLVWAKNKYTVTTDSLVNFKDEVVKCKVINIKTRHRRKKFHSTMLFNEQLGFVWIEVQFINGKRYSLELIGVEPDYCMGK